jgi:hypothetical protein
VATVLRQIIFGRFDGACERVLHAFWSMISSSNLFMQPGERRQHRLTHP